MFGKPKLSMYEDAISEFGINIEKSFTIGGKIRDFALCKKMHLPGISDFGFRERVYCERCNK